MSQKNAMNYFQFFGRFLEDLNQKTIKALGIESLTEEESSFLEKIGEKGSSFFLKGELNLNLIEKILSQKDDSEVTNALVTKLAMLQAAVNVFDVKHDVASSDLSLYFAQIRRMNPENHVLLRVNCHKQRSTL